MASVSEIDGAVKYVISLRADRPIEQCELTPNAFLYIKGGNMDNPTRAKIMDANPHKFAFVWRRSAKHQICENPICPRKDCYEPRHWCRSALGGHTLHCAVCERGGLPRYESVFCSKSCFVASWKYHCSLRHGGQLSSTRISSGHQQWVQGATEEYPADISDKLILAMASDISGPDAVDDSDWRLVSTDKVYTPTSDDVGRVLRVDVRAIAVNGGHILAGPITIVSDTVLSQPRPPPKRQLLPVISNGGSVLSSSSNMGARFRVISYNVLAEIYATKQAYPYCESWILSWAYRLSVLLQELEESQGDVICLQEVQADHYEQSILPYMQERGFDGLFKAKARESMGQYGKIDGCATFWRRSKFMMIENYSLDFNEKARQAASDMGLDEAEGRWFMNKLLRDNIAQIIVLEVISRTAVRMPRQSMQLCVVNTHLYANHLKPDVKLWQALTLMKHLEQFVLSRDVALLLCGDLNSEPTSAVYELIFEGGLVLPHPELSPSDSVPILPDFREILHSVDLESAMFAGLGTEPEFTNFTAKFRGTLDYICFSPNRLRVLGVSQIPDGAELENAVGVGLPCVSYPSDHLMLCCDLAFEITGSGGLTRTPKRKGGHMQSLGFESSRISSRGY